MQTRLVGNTQLVSGGAEKVAAVLALLEGEGIATTGNPDVYVRTYVQFGVDEAREIIDRASLKAMSGKRAFVVVAPDMTREAQNALLKTLEEPAGGETLFFFILAAPETLLPTVRSRAQMLSLGGDARADAVDVSLFLAADSAKRIDMLKPLLDKDTDDRRDTSAILAFLASLERALAQRSPKDRTGIAAVYRARRFATDKGALIKPLLEQVALLMARL